MHPLVVLLALPALARQAVEVRVTVSVDLTSTTRPFKHYWKRIFGSGHAALTVRPDWQDHLKQAVADLDLGGVRYHGILDDDMGVVPEPATLKTLDYNWTLIDKTWDYQVSLGVVPFVELSFMPCVLANCSWHGVNPTSPPCRAVEFHYQGVKQQPTDWNDWYNLVHALVAHAVERYGKAEVQKWDFEVWNEGHWMGMPFPQPYLTLFNASSRAVKAVDPGIRVGGPASANMWHVADFVGNATALGIPFDFVSTHHYPTDSCRPQNVGNSSVWDPDCFANSVKANRATVPNTTYYLTETNVGCCLGYTSHDTSAAAAFAFKTIGDLDGTPDVMSWWTFSDVFEEGGFPTSEFTNIYGLMTVHGIPKPGWRGFQLLAGAGDTRVPVTVSEKKAPRTAAAAAAPAAPAALAAGQPACLQGGMDGGDIHTANMSVATAVAWCLADSQCGGFSAAGQYPTGCGDASFDMHFKDHWAPAHRNADPELVSWIPGAAPSPPGPPAPADVPLVTAFATVNSTAPSTTPLDTLRLYLGFWSVVYDGLAPPADRSVAVSVTASLPRTAASAAVGGATTATVWIIDEGHANPLAAWNAMGSPAVPSKAQLATLIASSKVHPQQVPATVAEVAVSTDGATVEITVALTVIMVPNSAVMATFGMG